MQEAAILAEWLVGGSGGEKSHTTPISIQIYEYFIIFKLIFCGVAGFPARQSRVVLAMKVDKKPNFSIIEAS